MGKQASWREAQSVIVVTFDRCLVFSGLEKGGVSAAKYGGGLACVGGGFHHGKLNGHFSLY